MVACISTLSIFSVLGNGLVIGIIARFKKLRTFPNILIANLALVDLLNALINMPIYLLYAVLEVSWFKGKTLAILSFCLHRLSQLLNMVSMLVLLVNVLLAVAFDLRYFTWKTNERAMAIVVFEWLFSIAVVLSTSVSLFDVDLMLMCSIIVSSSLRNRDSSWQPPRLCLLCPWYLLRQRLNLSQLQAEARLQQDIKASKTVAMTVLASLVCYIQTVVYAASGRQDNDLTNAWLAFLVTFSIFISSGINPVIYCFRTRRFRLALEQLVKDPYGRSPFQETNERVEQNVRRLITKQAVASKNITKKRDEEASKENVPQPSGLGNDVKLLTHKLEPGTPVVKTAWAENDQNGSQGKSSANIEKRPTASGVNTKQEVIVEVHIYDKNKGHLQNATKK
ncbi:hypothetical protein ACROYT_G034465 [Oculina patagonica]